MPATGEEGETALAREEEVPYSPDPEVDKEQWEVEEDEPEGVEAVRNRAAHEA